MTSATNARRSRPRRFPDRYVVDVVLDLLADNHTIKEAAHKLGITVGSCKEYIWRERQRTGMKMLYNLTAYHVRTQSLKEPIR